MGSKRINALLVFHGTEQAAWMPLTGGFNVAVNLNDRHTLTPFLAHALWLMPFKTHGDDPDQRRITTHPMGIRSRWK